LRDGKRRGDRDQAACKKRLVLHIRRIICGVVPGLRGLSRTHLTRRTQSTQNM
jgi:hypothetical protein